MKTLWSLHFALLTLLFSTNTGLAVPQMILSGGPSVNVVIDNGASAPQTRDLTLFQIVPAAAGATKRTYRITNSGDSPLNVQAPTMNSTIAGSGAAAFRFEDTGAGRYETKIAAGGFDDFDIIFDPEKPGTYRATVILANNSGGATTSYTFEIQGSATDAKGDVGINITGLAETLILPGDATPDSEDGTDFGVNRLGAPAIFRTFTIGNASFTQQLRISGGIVLENAAGSGFRVSSSPPSIIGIGQTANFTIRLDNSGAEGSRSATVSVTTDDPLNPVYTFAIGAFVGTPTDPTIVITNEGDDLIFDIDGTAGKTYALFTSTDLAGWSPVLSRTGLTPGTFRFEDFIASVGAGSRRFWRIEEE